MVKVLRAFTVLACVAVPSIWSGNVGAQGMPDGSGCQAVENSYCVPAGGSVSLQSSTGIVSIIREASAIAGASGAQLLAGDRIVVDEGSALVSLAPTCQINVSNFSSASLSTVNGQTCLTVAGATQTTSTDSNATTGLLAGGAALGGAAALTYGLSNGSEGSP